MSLFLHVFSFLSLLLHLPSSYTSPLLHLPPPTPSLLLHLPPPMPSLLLRLPPPMPSLLLHPPSLPPCSISHLIVSHCPYIFLKLTPCVAPSYHIAHQYFDWKSGSELRSIKYKITGWCDLSRGINLNPNQLNARSCPSLLFRTTTMQISIDTIHTATAASSMSILLIQIQSTS